jgi:hypothetical protein
VKASERLLNLEGHRLEVFRNPAGVCVKFQDSGIRTTGCLGVYGTGPDFESACENYLEQISGKTLIFAYATDRQREVQVL